MNTSRPTIWALAAGLPLLAGAAALLVNVDAASWPSISAPLLRSLLPDALLYTAGGVVIAAPLAGVACASATRTTAGARRPAALSAAAAWPLFVAVLLCAATSALTTFAALQRVDGAAVAFVVSSHATLAAVALALGAFGAFCGAAFRDSLDAAACSLSVVLLAAGGLLVAGASVADAPRRVIEIALTASPFVAMTAAAHIDVVRMDLLYRISPLAHIQITYPDWYAACGWYLFVALICFMGVTWKCGSWRTAPAR